VWEEKPWWCQPWTIVATGAAVVAAARVAAAGLAGVTHIDGLRHLWLVAAAVIAAWWGLFLGVYPQAMKAQRLAALEQNRQEQRDIGTDD